MHAFLKNSHATLVGLSQPEAAPDLEQAEPSSEFPPAVSVRKSLADPDYIVSMIDGKRYRTLRRHLSTRDLTPEAYRERYGLKPDYPMVAPGYAAQSSKLAKELGLGRKGQAARAAASASPPVLAEAPTATTAEVAAEKTPRAKRSRKPKSAASETAQTEA